MMNKNINSPNHLTEFAPHSDDVRPAGNFFSRLFKRNPAGKYAAVERDPFAPVQMDDDDETDDDRNSVAEYSASTDDNGDDVDSHSELSAAGTNVPVERPPARTLSSVLKRLSRIVAGRSQTPTAYRDSDFKQYWMPDGNCHECYECGMKFHTLRRRHHCRICGQIFCSQCCNRRVPGSFMGYTGFLRACTYCCDVVHHYAQNPDVGDSLSTLDDKDLRMPSGPVLNTESLLSTVVESPSRGSVQTPSLTWEQRRSSRIRLPSIFDEDAKQRLHNNMDADPELPGLLDTLQIERRALLQDSVHLRDLWQSMKHVTDGVSVQGVRHRLRTYTDCMVGTQITDWLLDNNKASTREQAIMLGQALIDAKWITSTVASDCQFRDDHTFYRPFEMALRDDPIVFTSLPQASDIELEDDVDGPLPLWVKKIHQEDKDDDVARVLSPELPKVSSSVCNADMEVNNSSVFYVDSPMFIRSVQYSNMDHTTLTEDSSQALKSGSVVPSCVEVGLLPAIVPHIMPAEETASAVELSVNEEHCVARQESVSEDGGGEDHRTREKLFKLHIDHLTKLVYQLLDADGLPVKWADTILTLTRKVSQTVRPDVRSDGDDMDIRQYISIKVIPCGSATDTDIINGVVCTKIVAHRKMRQQITNPKILLLRSPIEYQRVENKFSSLEPQILQEHEYLKNCISRIATLQPDILLVEKTVSRLAQNFLLEAGITLVLNVKPSVMERVARFTQATIVSSVDSLVNKTTMGCCQKFFTEIVTLTDGSSKSLMYFDGCAKNLGCTITLSGGSPSELKQVKRVLRFMTYAMYNARLETAFLSDEYVSSSWPASQHTSTPDGDLNEIESNRNSPVDHHMTSTPSTQVRSSVPESTAHSDIESVTDFSDPLRHYQRSSDESIFGNSLPLSVLSVSVDSQRRRMQLFQNGLNDRVLSVSPCMHYTLPYLETEPGFRCLLRCYFPEDIFWSKYFENEKLNGTAASDSVRHKMTESVLSLECVTALLPTHPFVVEKLSAPPTSPSVQMLLSDYRARGGRLPLPSTANGQCWVKKKKDIDETNVESPIDCLDPLNHQQISVLFSSYSPESANAPAPCVAPWVVSMEYYGRNDVTLGGFLERYCFRETYHCSNRCCDAPMINHIRRFVHGDGCIQVMMKKLDMAMAGTADTIYTWSYCRKCREGTPVTTLSPDAWSLSFAKYLELRFNSHCYVRRSAGKESTCCQHSLHHDHYQYFGCHLVVASFRYSTITLREVALPGIVIQILPLDVSRQQLEDEGKMLNFQAKAVFLGLVEQLHRQKKEVQSDGMSIIITEKVLLLQNEYDSVMQKIEYVQSLIQNMKQMARQDVSMGLQVQDAFVGIKHEVAELVTVWNDRIHEFETQLRKPSDKNKSISINKLSSSLATTVSNVSEPSSCPGSYSSVVDNELTVTDVSGEPADCGLLTSSLLYGQMSVSSTGQLSDVCQPDDDIPCAELSPVFEIEKSSDHMLLVNGEVIEHSALSKTQTESTSSKSKSSDVTKKPPVKSIGRDNNITAQPDVEKKDRTAGMKQIFSSLLSGGGNITVQIPFCAEEHHLLPACQQVPVVVYDQEPSSVIAYALSSQDYKQYLHELRSVIDADELSSGQKRPSSGMTTIQTAASDSDLADGTGKKGVLSFLRGASSRDKSPNKYGIKYEVDSVKYTPCSVEKDSLTDADDMVDGSAALSDSQKSVKSIRQQPPNYHIELQFSDVTTKFYCRVYFANQFCELRKLIFPDGEDRYIRSLSRCFTWLARGGKSGSSFCKTQDDRFILKQMSRYEVQSFNEFAPHYFQYVNTAHNERKPTVLAKIVGVYKIGFQNSKTGAALKQDLLVMENLFYNRKISQIFDLKGSARNRLVSTSGKRPEELVLLDENLLKVSVDSPLYVYPHSKMVLTSAITQDTLFLAGHSVMDYSLLVGLDDVTNELVIGIIDYIRTFTWDKMLEMVLKKNLSGTMPTVVSPELYRRRFLDAMDRYFLLVPNRWTGLENKMNC